MYLTQTYRISPFGSNGFCNFPSLFRGPGCSFARWCPCHLFPLFNTHQPLLLQLFIQCLIRIPLQLFLTNNLSQKLLLLNSATQSSKIPAPSSFHASFPIASSLQRQSSFLFLYYANNKEGIYLSATKKQYLLVTWKGIYLRLCMPKINELHFDLNYQMLLRNLQKPKLKNPRTSPCPHLQLINHRYMLSYKKGRINFEEIQSVSKQ